MRLRRAVSTAETWPSASATKFRKQDVLDGVVGDHVAWGAFVDFEAEGSTPQFVHRRADAVLVVTHGCVVGRARRFGVVLRLSEAAIIPSDEDLHLLTAAPVSAEHVE